MSHFISNLKWAWQAHFLSLSPVTLENWVSFQDVQMILVQIFEIPYGDALAKNVKSRCVQIIVRSTDIITHLSWAIKTRLKMLQLTQTLWTKGHSLHMNSGKSHLFNGEEVF